jgi:hypothetical protein
MLLLLLFNLQARTHKKCVVELLKGNLQVSRKRHHGGGPRRHHPWQRLEEASMRRHPWESRRPRRHHAWHQRRRYLGRPVTKTMGRCVRRSATAILCQADDEDDGHHVTLLCQSPSVGHRRTPLSRALHDTPPLPLTACLGLTQILLGGERE